MRYLKRLGQALLQRWFVPKKGAQDPPPMWGERTQVLLNVQGPQVHHTGKGPLSSKSPLFTKVLRGFARSPVLASRFSIMRPLIRFAPQYFSSAARLRDHSMSIFHRSPKLSGQMKEPFEVNAPLFSATSLSQYNLDSFIAKGSNAAVFSARVDYGGDVGIHGNQHGSGVEVGENVHSSAPQEVAMKVMFNYADRSDADQVMKAHVMETLPAQLPSLRSHPNIVKMGAPFTDQILPRQLPSAAEAFPALIDYGRSTTCFLPMKRYSYTLRQYLEYEGDRLTVSDRLKLFQQLVEAVAWLEKVGIAHRDLKSNNLLIEECENQSPKLVVADFGCAARDLLVPYTSDYVSKGGNLAMMAPEISLAKPGPGMELDYRRADAWSVGLLAYEIFGCERPLTDTEDCTFENIPALDGELAWVMVIVRNLLAWNPRQRWSCSDAATLLQLRGLCQTEQVDPISLTQRDVLEQVIFQMWTTVAMCSQFMSRERWAMGHWYNLLLLYRETPDTLRQASYRLNLLLCATHTSTSSVDS